MCYHCSLSGTDIWWSFAQAMQATYDGRPKRQRQAAVPIDQPILDGAHAFSVWAMKKGSMKKVQREAVCHRRSTIASIQCCLQPRVCVLHFQLQRCFYSSIPQEDGDPGSAIETRSPTNPCTQLGPGFSVTSMAERGRVHHNHIRRCDKVTVYASGNKFDKRGDFLMMN